MSAPATDPPSSPVEVSKALSALTERLYSHVRAYSEAERKAVALRAKADSIENHAYMNASGPVEERKRAAAIEAEQAEEEALVAEAVVRSLKAKIKAIEVDIDVHRTFGATVRAEFKTLGMGPGA